MKPARIIAIANPKGGVAKSTTAANLASAAVARGASVLMIDLDPQGTSTKLAGFTEALGQDAGFMFRDEPVAPSDLIVSSKYGFDVVPGGASLIHAEEWLATATLGEQRLRLLFRKDERLTKYDYIFVDTAGYKGRLLTSALLSSTDVMIPIRPSVASTDELPPFIGIINEINTIREGMNDDVLNILGVFFVQANERTKNLRARREDILAAAEGGFLTALNTIIPESTAMEEAADARAPVMIARPRSKVAERYHDLLAEAFTLSAVFQSSAGH